jgi:hypothetical protein
MKKPKDDFEFIDGLLTEFFQRRNLKSALNVIHAQDITGWEIWFQIELARFLADHESEPEWYREESLEFDYRMEKTRYFFKPDFIIRKKGAAVDRYVALEIKQHRQMGNCINNMIADLLKVAKMRRSEIDLRSFWAVGIFHTDPEGDAVSAIESKLSSSGLGFYSSVAVVNKIRGTQFSYALF